MYKSNQHCFAKALEKSYTIVFLQTNKKQTIQNITALRMLLNCNKCDVCCTSEENTTITRVLIR